MRGCKVQDGFFVPGTDTHFLKLNGYQRPIFDAAMKHVTPGVNAVAVDAGAHVGIFSRRMAKAGFYKVLAFEPEAENYRCLVANTRGSGVVPIHAALGKGEGWGSPRIDASHNSGAKGFTPGDTGATPMFSLDFFADNPIGIIKIDTQGSEHDILLGAERILRQYGPVLIVERPEAITLDYLHEFGYQVAVKANKDFVFKKV